jgi:hypothetical protein
VSRYVERRDRCARSIPDQLPSRESARSGPAAISAQSCELKWTASSSTSDSWMTCGQQSDDLSLRAVVSRGLAHRLGGDSHGRSSRMPGCRRDRAAGSERLPGAGEDGALARRWPLCRAGTDCRHGSGEPADCGKKSMTCKVNRVIFAIALLTCARRHALPSWRS